MLIAGAGRDDVRHELQVECVAKLMRCGMTVKDLEATLVPTKVVTEAFASIMETPVIECSAIDDIIEERVRHFNRALNGDVNAAHELLKIGTQQNLLMAGIPVSMIKVAAADRRRLWTLVEGAVTGDVPSTRELLVCGMTRTSLTAASVPECTMMNALVSLLTDPSHDAKSETLVVQVGYLNCATNGRADAARELLKFGMPNDLRAAGVPYCTVQEGVRGLI